MRPYAPLHCCVYNPETAIHIPISPFYDHEISLQKIGCFSLVFQKRLFCDAKQPLLPCKTYAFGIQNNRFWSVKA
ncbi:hypothetical protein CBG55_10255 [Prevotella intermedia]|uniref:Uncharacterized protein n=1 Tax=Prevotella intermedia TaxID=28131 RepID=A0A2M8TJT9_PREIN|nr:hypothetical protein CBG55_10255 [Prevotella intermedia]PJI24208.1 hypothetical protein CTM59_08705 [Prevotella intermedia]